MQWLIIYTKDYDQTRQATIIIAATYTQALLEFELNNSTNAIALEIIKI